MDWRRQYDLPPPVMEEENPFSVALDRRYEGLGLPETESLADCVERVGRPRPTAVLMIDGWVRPRPTAVLIESCLLTPV